MKMFGGLKFWVCGFRGGGGFEKSMRSRGRA